VALLVQFTPLGTGVMNSFGVSRNGRIGGGDFQGTAPISTPWSGPSNRDLSGSALSIGVQPEPGSTYALRLSTKADVDIKYTVAAGGRDFSGTVGKDRTYGTIVGRIAAGPLTYCRVSTDDLAGRIAAYVGEGRFTDDTLETFGGYGVVEIPRFQDLLRHVCRRGFEHHVAMTRAEVAGAVDDALGTYLGWDVYRHV